MEVKTVARYVRISSTKVRKVARAVKGKPVEDGLSALGFMPHRSARVLGKIIRSAVANAEQKPDIEVDNLSIANIVVNQGPSLKRFRPRAMGRATRILKRTSHITVVLAEE
ncbi:MAG: 50S ribosomal protein L22 [Deltaproteobacteria bacterium]|jgi:large subunit ribosomal protein L22|nr:50S ribosomal protein L22 [Deltaproteobacteria bacterium]MBW1794916.1 50S ribosomal protein L22 [Deltaproteobacteria bacterium]MBW2331548.1 50S ribosomal protein L22 [Deltaproteobacteria bacterium]MCK4487365.1 50S ribosomal protein L22 [Desulfobacterales bacterium]